MSEKKRIVFWSGGYDSTLILWNEAKRAKENHENFITAWSLKWDRLGENKVKSEELCRKSFIAFVKESLGIRIDNEVIELKHDMQPFSNGLSQAPLFMSLCAYMAQDGDLILFGFHRGDDFWHYVGEFNRVLDSVNKSMKKTVKYTFPLEWEAKADIVRQVREEGIERYCWTCEGATTLMVPCNNCVPCRNLAIANSEIEIRKKFNSRSNIIEYKPYPVSPVYPLTVEEKGIRLKHETVQKLPTQSGDEEKEPEYSSDQGRKSDEVLDRSGDSEEISDISSLTSKI